MQNASVRRPALGFLGALLTLILLLGLLLPVVAQDGSSFATNTPAAPGEPTQPPADAPFATNTPTSAAPMLDFATNTPGSEPTPVPSPTPLGPAAAAFNYSLRLWVQADLVELAYQQITSLAADDEPAQRALQITLYELERRFPGAPRDIAQRQRLIDAMLGAPLGSIDMRGMVRPFIEVVVNERPGLNEFTVNGFNVALTTVNLDNRGEADALVRMTYTDAEGVVRYDDLVLALRDSETGALRFLPGAEDRFAVPFGGVSSLVVDRISDVNRDSLDEVVVRVDDGEINQRLVILGFRNGEVLDLAQPGQQLRFHEILSWPTAEASPTPPELRVRTLRAESEAPDWPCASEQNFTWTYDRNFYRPSTEINSRFVPQDSLGCTLLAAEPLFALPPLEATGIVENALLEYSFEAPGADRALMTLAMLYALDGRLEDARATAQAVIPADDSDSWAAQQGTALLSALEDSSNTALDVCAAVASASEHPACDIEAVLERTFGFLDLTTDRDLVEQLEGAGLEVRQQTEVSEVGRATRTVANFALAPDSWWGFVAQRDGTYSAERVDVPAEFAPTGDEAPRLGVPDAAYAALFVNDNPAEVLNILANLETENAQQAFTPQALYLRALSLDLTAAREEARLLYYDIWERHPQTVWGQLAAAHLERR